MQVTEQLCYGFAPSTPTCCVLSAARCSTAGQLELWDRGHPAVITESRTTAVIPVCCEYKKYISYYKYQIWQIELWKMYKMTHETGTAGHVTVVVLHSRLLLVVRGIAAKRLLKDSLHLIRTNPKSSCRRLSTFVITKNTELHILSRSHPSVDFLPPSQFWSRWQQVEQVTPCLSYPAPPGSLLPVSYLISHFLGNWLSLPGPGK